MKRIENITESELYAVKSSVESIMEGFDDLPDGAWLEVYKDIVEQNLIELGFDHKKDKDILREYWSDVMNAKKVENDD